MHINSDVRGAAHRHAPDELTGSLSEVANTTSMVGGWAPPAGA